MIPEPQKPSAGPELADVACYAAGTESEILFTGLHRQRMACGGYAVTGNPITVRLSPAVKYPKDGTPPHNAQSAAARPESERTSND